MKQLTFWFDPVSPYAYLAFEHLPLALQGGLPRLPIWRALLSCGVLRTFRRRGLPSGAARGCGAIPRRPALALTPE